MTELASPPLGIYIHWPFCVSKCPYCDFNSHIAKSIDLNRWTSAYLNELNFSYSQTPNHTVQTIFFGGGTPSLMPPQLMETIIENIHTLWKCSSNLEVSFEANPTSVESKKFKDFKNAGANRVSIGIQALNDKDLQFLGRPHNLSEGVNAIETAKANFDRISFDLIYARPQQTLEHWRQELRCALTLEPSHISLYQLTIEPGTAFYTSYSRGDFQLPSENLSAELYESTEAILNEHNLSAYEVSNYAQSGEECRHNLMYWNYQDYIGIGPGAHGRITTTGGKISTRRHRAPDKWLQQCLQKKHGQHENTLLHPKDEVIELMLMGLRLRKGVSLSQFLKLSSNVMPNHYFGEKWDQLVNTQLITLKDDYIRTTASGFLKTNSILNYLFT